MAWIASHGATSVAEHLRFIESGMSLVAEENGVLVGFIVGRDYEKDLYIAELAVARAHQRRGHGRDLMAAAIAHAGAAGKRAVTLTTFRTVPWNGPYYASLGFVEVAPVAGSYLFGAIADEEARGLPDRCAMKLAL